MATMSERTGLRTDIADSPTPAPLIDREFEEYGTAESLSKLWSPQWLDVFRHGFWCSGDEPPPKPIKSQFDVYHPYSCNSCKRGPFTGTKTLRCSKCRVVRYCGLEHQKEDWEDHKRWCKVFVKSRVQATDLSERIERPEDLDDWRDHSWMLANWIVREIKGPTRHSAVHMMLLQPRCRKCLVSGTVDGVELILCPGCGDVALCKDCHKDVPSDGDNARETHGELQFHPERGTAECDEHILSLTCTGMVVEQGSPLCMESDTDSDTFFHPSDWGDYLKVKRGDFHSVPKDPMMLMAPVIAFITDGLSIPLTIQHALCRPEVMGPKIASSITKLVVHLVGASAVEETSVNKFIELIRLMPALNYLRIITIGPDLEALSSGFPSVGKPLNFVDEHESPIRDGCDARFVRKPGYYHEIGHDLEEPNLVVACHSGLHDERFTERWLPTIQFLASGGVPCIFTGYSREEVASDERILEEAGVKILVSTTSNPFQGMRPFPDPLRAPTDFIYSNAFYTIFRGTVKPKTKSVYQAPLVP